MQADISEMNVEEINKKSSDDRSVEVVPVVKF